MKKNPELMISNSDNGSVTVISKCIDYFRAMNELVNNFSHFKKLSIDPTKQKQDKNNRLVRALLRKKLITELQSKRLTTYTANPPRLFGQIKVHKPGYPIRPIVSTINTAAYRLSRFLVDILNKAYPKPTYNIKTVTGSSRTSEKSKLNLMKRWFHLMLSTALAISLSTWRWIL